MKGWLLVVAATVAAVAAILMTGLGVARVLTGSMIPWAMPGDVLIVVKPNVSAPGIGRVVVSRPYFVQGGDRLPPIGHRIIGGQPGNWQTKGDANPEPDAWTVTEVDKVVIGRIPAKIVPYAAAGLAMIVVLALLWPGSTIIHDDDDIGPPPTGPPVLFYWPPDA